MKKCIVILGSPKHRDWTALTKASIELFWPYQPEILVYSEDDNRDWLSTAVSMAESIDSLGYDIVHLFLADHAIADPVNKAKLIGAECSLELFDAVCYRSLEANNPNVKNGHIIPSPDNNFCLCPGVWNVKALLKNLSLIDKLLTSPEQRTPAHVDKLTHSGIFPNTAMITGVHHTVPLPFHGVLFQGKIFDQYEKYYTNQPILLQLYKTAYTNWTKSKS